VDTPIESPRGSGSYRTIYGVISQLDISLGKNTLLQIYTLYLTVSWVHDLTRINTYVHGSLSLDLHASENVRQSGEVLRQSKESTLVEPTSTIELNEDSAVPSELISLRRQTDYSALKPRS
jgi:hypothetical protein